MSFKGIGVYSESSLQKDESVRLLITSKSFSRHIQGEGKIKYVQKILRNEKILFRIGIEFVSVDSDLVRDIVESLRQEAAKRSLGGNP